MADGDEFEVGPGEVSYLEPGHDAWVIGNEPLVAIDWGGAHVWATHEENLVLVEWQPRVLGFRAK